MKRYDTIIRDDVLYLEGEDSWFEIGSINDICSLVGGETYTIEYDERQRTVGWLDTDSDGTLSFDVREIIAEMDYNDDFVATLETIDSNKTDEEGYPLRASVFADLMIEIWNSKGNLDHKEESV
jgi:hypothetical protein